METGECFSQPTTKPTMCDVLCDLERLTRCLAVPACCKTSLRSVLTAAAAGSSPVVPAISFSITWRAILRFELARQSKVACGIPLCPIKTLNCKTCLSSMQASGLDDRVGTSSVAGVTVEQEPVRISACFSRPRLPRRIFNSSCRASPAERLHLVEVHRRHVHGQRGV